jgi:hypothetical protein
VRNPRNLDGSVRVPELAEYGPGHPLHGQPRAAETFLVPIMDKDNNMIVQPMSRSERRKNGITAGRLSGALRRKAYKELRAKQKEQGS